MKLATTTPVQKVSRSVSILIIVIIIMIIITIIIIIIIITITITIIIIIYSKKTDQLSTEDQLVLTGDKLYIIIKKTYKRVMYANILSNQK